MPDRPNILVIMSDQHHAGVMGCAGDNAAITPNLDRLAAGGVRLANTYCPAPVCGASRASFMTARHPFETDVWGNEEQLNPDIPTFAHAFLAAGYHTMLSGRMHFVGADQRHGFTGRLVGDVSESAHLAAGWKLDRVLGELRDTCGCGHSSVIKSGPGRTGYHAYDQAVCDKTIRWLGDRARDRSGQPFLLTVGFVSPHCPFVCPPEDFGLAAERISPADLPPNDTSMHPFVREQQIALGLETPPPLDAQWRARAAYYGLCSFMDRQVGRVLDALEDAGLAKNTVVVYTSDHGEMLGEHGLWWKGTFFDGACRVPMIVSWPGNLPAGTSIASNVSLIDVGPTILDLAAAPPMPGASGRSFRCLLDGEVDAWDDTAFSEYADAGPPAEQVQPRRMVRQGPWKLNYYHQRGCELFNMAEDPGETQNRCDDPGCADVRDRLEKRALQGWNPDYVIRRLGALRDQLGLVGNWVNQTRPAEPDEVWFDHPPENVWNQVAPPDA